jgi:outer membrane lipoprotein-sorting protein
VKKSGYLIVIFLTVVLIMCLFGTQGTAGEKIYQMKGEITAIESVHNTVVIEVPMGKRMFTVAGPP